MRRRTASADDALEGVEQGIMAEKARIETVKADNGREKSRPVFRVRSLAHVLGAAIIGVAGVAAITVAAAWGAGWGSDPAEEPMLRPTLPSPMKMAPDPFTMAEPARTVTDIQNFHSSGIIALAPNWLFSSQPQAAHDSARRSAPAADETLAVGPASDAGTSPEPAVEIATTVPQPVPNPLFAGRLQLPDTERADEAVAQSAEDTRTQLAMAPLPPRNPRLSVQAASSGPLPEDEPDDAPTSVPGPPPPEATRPELTYPGPQDRFALYDIKAKKVYLPNGKKLEAHSGYGDKMDDIRHVSVKMYGPTPPNIYRLTWREQLFHGVKAVRMTPIGKNAMYGRNGFLVHSYLLGPRGDSNGCISIADYDVFKEAFAKGQIDRVVVVESMPKGDQPINPLLAWLTGKSRDKDK